MSENSFWNNFTTGLSDFADDVGDLFRVDSTIGQSGNIKPDDVRKTKSALNAIGNYNVPDFGITDIPDMGMIDGLKNFQANNGLKVDGVMKPGGPTENALGQTLVNNGISTTDLLEKAKTPSINPTSEMPKPTPAAMPPQTSWSASAPLGEAAKPKKSKLPKIDPMTGLEDPLASAPKGKMPTKKQWEEVAKMQQQKASSAIIPQGDTVDQRIRSMMSDKRYGDKYDTRLRDHVVKEFERAYPGEVQYDETGKMVQPTAVITPDQVEAFDPDGGLSSIMQVNDDGSYTFTPEIVEPSEAELTYIVSDGEEERFTPTVPLVEAQSEHQETQVAQPSSDDVSLVQAFKDEWKRAKIHGVKRYVGPHGEKAIENAKEGLEKLASFFGPQADVLGASAESAKVTQAIKNGDYGAALAHLGMTGAELADIVTPGNMTALAGMVKFKDGDMFDASDFEEFFRKHLEGGDKGDRIPDVTFDFGPLEQRLYDQYKEFNPKVADVENRLRMPAGSMAHWDANRRKAIEPYIDRIPNDLTNANYIRQKIDQPDEALLISNASRVIAPIGLLDKTPGTVGMKTIFGPLRDRALRKAIKEGK